MARRLLTDQSLWDLPPTFGRIDRLERSAAGDFAFSTGMQSALFLRRAGTSSLVRVIQAGDAISVRTPSRVTTAPGAKVNASGRVCVHAEFYHNGTIKAGLFTYDGSALRPVVISDEIAPDPSGAQFGRSIQLGDLNSSGDVVFTAPLAPIFSPARLTIFAARGNGTVVRIVGPGDSVPGTAATFDQVSYRGFNNRGDVLFNAAIVGGSGGFGTFLATSDGIRRIVATGDPDLKGGYFQFPTGAPGTLFLNNIGQVALAGGSNTIYVSSPETGLALVVSLATPVPEVPGGSLRGIDWIDSFGDSGMLVFRSQISGGTVTGNALFRYRPNAPLEVVAYRNQVVPGAGGRKSNGMFTNPSMNENGTVIFYDSLQGSPASAGIFTQSGADTPMPIVLNGQDAPATVGGRFAGVSQTAYLLADGTAYFESTLLAAAADYGSFLATSSAITTLVTPADPLPAGSRVVFRLGPWLSGAGDFVAFNAQRAGGGTSWWAHNSASGETFRVVGEGDAGPSSYGGWLHLGGQTTLPVNSTGSVTFLASVPGVTSNALFLWNAETGIRKLGAPGDMDLSTGRTFASFTKQALAKPAMINDADQVVTKVTFTNGGTGLFVASPDAPPQKIAVTGDAAPTGGTFSSLAGYGVINAAGHVAFGATGTNGASGIFVGAPGQVPVKIAATGDVAPGGATFTGFSSAGPSGFNAGGDVVFTASLSTGQTGLFTAKSGGGIHAVVINGDTAPSGGMYNITLATSDAVINDLGDLVFHAPLTGGPANSGFFVRRSGSSSIHAAMVQGQPAPGTSGVFGTLRGSVNLTPGEIIALGPTGEAVFQATVEVGGTSAAGNFRYRRDDTLEKLYVAGDAPPDGGPGIALSTAQEIGVGREGQFYLWSALGDADAAYAIYVTLPANQPPVARVGADQTVECESSAGTNVTLDGSSSSDPENQALSYVWTDESGRLVATSAVAQVPVPLGTHAFVLTVTDSGGLSSSGTTRITVRDTTPPVVTVSASPAVLWPPNHKLVPVQMSVQVADAGDPQPTVTLVSIECSEAGAEQDVENATLGSDDRLFLLRAERDARGRGRIYTVTYRVVDASGNATLARTTIAVPHDQRMP